MARELHRAPPGVAYMCWLQRDAVQATEVSEADKEGGTEPTTINLLGLVLWIIRKVRGK